MKKIIILLLAALAVACGQRARVSGTLAGADTLYLEHIAPTGLQVVDSVIAKGGRFAFGVALPDGAALYNVRSGDFRIPLVLRAGERIVLDGTPRDYGVAGSADSEQLRALTMLLGRGAARLDSLSRRYAVDADTLVARQYLREYYRVKQQQIRLILERPASLAALYGLYQRLPGDATLFNGATDVIYYRTIADSLAAHDPASPYLPALRGQIARMEPLAVGALPESDFPDLFLPDMYGKPVRLSSLSGQVVLLDFWSAALQQSRSLNAELKEVYARFHAQGLEVYQVGVDTDRALWVELVLQQRLPWVSVSDLRGTRSPALGLWNVTALPANFLIDRSGNIVAKNLYGPALEAKLQEVL